MAKCNRLTPLPFKGLTGLTLLIIDHEHCSSWVYRTRAVIVAFVHLLDNVKCLHVIFPCHRERWILKTWGSILSLMTDVAWSKEERMD